jgi:hypothetical protein
MDKFYDFLLATAGFLVVCFCCIAVIVGVAWLVGFDPAQANRERIEDCRSQRGTIVLNSRGYLDHCIIGPAPVVIGGK